MRSTLAFQLIGLTLIAAGLLAVAFGAPSQWALLTLLGSAIVFVTAWMQIAARRRLKRK